MSKKRVNITVDEWVKDELDRRDDINVSGAVNDFFKRYLAGDDTDQVAKEMRIQHLKEKEEEAQENAQQYRAEWQSLQDELEDEREQQAEVWDRALSMLRLREGYKGAVRIDSPDEAVEDFADDLGMDVDAFREELKARWSDGR